MRLQILSEMGDENDTQDEAVELESRKKINTYININYSVQSSLSVKMRQIIASGDVFCSFEFTPSAQAEHLRRLLICMDRLAIACNPLFNAITCHDNGSMGGLSPGIRLSEECKQNHSTLLHLVARGLCAKRAHEILRCARTLGIKSVFVLRGDDTANRSGTLASETEFPFAADLVQFIRDSYGDDFTICVAGYPAKHPLSVSLEEDIYYLKEKVKAGADFIITQVTFEGSVFIKFVQMCRKAEIHVPIIPGILAVQGFSSLVNMSKICRFDVPEAMLKDLEDVKQSEQAVVNYCIFKAVEMVKHLLTKKITSGIHFFTLNREVACQEICRQVGFCDLPFPGALEMNAFELQSDSEFKTKQQQQQIV